MIKHNFKNHSNLKTNGVKYASKFPIGPEKKTGRRQGERGETQICFEISTVGLAWKKYLTSIPFISICDQQFIIHLCHRRGTGQIFGFGPHFDACDPHCHGT
jgi:hypothetical protein